MPEIGARIVVGKDEDRIHRCANFLKGRANQFSLFINVSVEMQVGRFLFLEREVRKGMGLRALKH